MGELGAVVHTVNYTYDTEWKDKLTSYDGKSIFYDAIGNPTNYMGAQMTWFARQMQSYTKGNTSTTYKYDSDGLRTEKTVNGVKHEYYYVDGLLVYENIGDENLMYYRYDQNGTVIAINRIRLSDGATGLLYPVTNSRGDVVELRNGNGVLNAKYTYDSWGKLISITDANGNPVSEDSLAMFNSIRYRGYVYDRETGLYYLQSRYYDPETGRFLNADSVDYIGYSGEVLSYNVFAYCENGPINNADYSGNAVNTNRLYTIIKNAYSGEYGFMWLGFHNPNANNLTDFFDKTWSTKKWCIQRNLGYCDLYDNAAWAMGCFIHCLKSEFRYKNKWWRIELWMGRYGISVGGEIGIYNSNSKSKPKIFNCVKTSEEQKMSFTLYEYSSLSTLLFNSKSMKSLFSISTNIYEDNKHWWLTGFLYNLNIAKHPPYSKNLFMNADIIFDNKEMADKFAENLNCTGLTKTAFKVKVVKSNKKYKATIQWTSRYKKL